MTSEIIATTTATRASRVATENDLAIRPTRAEASDTTEGDPSAGPAATVEGDDALSRWRRNRITRTYSAPDVRTTSPTMQARQGVERWLRTGQRYPVRSSLRIAK
jgi:hypothetical protein